MRAFHVKGRILKPKRQALRSGPLRLGWKGSVRIWSGFGCSLGVQNWRREDYFDFVRGVCNLVFVLLLLNAWVQVTQYQSNCLGIPIRRRRWELHCCFRLPWFHGWCHRPRATPPCSKLRSTTMRRRTKFPPDTFYLVAAVLSWFELVVMEGAPPRRDHAHEASLILQTRPHQSIGTLVVPPQSPIFHWKLCISLSSC